VGIPGEVGKPYLEVVLTGNMVVCRRILAVEVLRVLRLWVDCDSRSSWTC
jgi:hypothetical protein